MTIKAMGTSNITIIDGVFTVDTLPDPSQYVDRYARVSDLFGGKRDLVLASQDAFGTYWQPVRPTYKGIMEITGDHTLLPLKTPSILTLTGSIALGIQRSIDFSTVKVFPGCQFVVRNKLASMLGSIKLLSGAVTLLNGLAINSSMQYYYDPQNGWEQF